MVPSIQIFLHYVKDSGQEKKGEGKIQKKAEKSPENDGRCFLPRGESEFGEKSSDDQSSQEGGEGWP